MFRTVTVTVMVVSFFVLGITDCITHNWRTGIASILLGLVQAILFWR